MPEHIRILLSEQASATLLAAGECFAIAGKSSHPEQPGRVVIHLVPVAKALADGACGVILGTHRAVRKKDGGKAPAPVVERGE